jgi:hypothetical protein
MVAEMAQSWHDRGMTRARISTTVDRDLLDNARQVHAGTTDAELVDEALTALLRSYRSAAIDAAYEVAYRDHPIDDKDEWGDLASFRDAVAAT